MTIRRATTEDFLQIAALDREAWQQNRNSEFIPDGEHVWRHWCTDALVFVALQNDQITGAVVAFPTINDRFCLHKVFVAAESRGSGIGTKLMKAALAEIDSLGKPVYLTVDPENRSAIAIYRKLGFTEEKFVRSYYRPNEDRLELTRPAG